MDILDFALSKLLPRIYKLSYWQATSKGETWYSKEQKGHIIDKEWSDFYFMYGIVQQPPTITTGKKREVKGARRGSLNHWDAKKFLRKDYFNAFDNTSYIKYFPLPLDEMAWLIENTDLKDFLLAYIAIAEGRASNRLVDKTYERQIGGKAKTRQEKIIAIDKVANTVHAHGYNPVDLKISGVFPDDDATMMGRILNRLAGD